MGLKPAMFAVEPGLYIACRGAEQMVRPPTKQASNQGRVSDHHQLRSHCKAMASPSSSVFSTVFLLTLFFLPCYSGVKGYPATATSSPRETALVNSTGEQMLLQTWCVALPSTDPESLQENIQYACNQVDCSAINPGGDCFTPNTDISHASVVMNLYYTAVGKNIWNCNFMASSGVKTGMVTITDPSFGACTFP